MAWSGKKSSSSCAKGKRGEEIAVEYLQNIDYRILATNYKSRGAEIDIVALHQNELVFIEVKSGKQIDRDLEEKISRAKKHKIEQAIRAFVYHNRMGHYPVRFEVLAVRSPGNEVSHYREQFFDDLLDCSAGE